MKIILAQHGVPIASMTSVVFLIFILVHPWVWTTNHWSTRK